MKSVCNEYFELFKKIDFEKIQDHPNILIAARFWDDERYYAAKTCYKFMRAIDDLIDHHKAAYKCFSENEKKEFSKKVDEWIKQINGLNKKESHHNELMETLCKFQIPAWPMQNFAKSMIYDIYNNGFPSLQAFLDYAEGASIAPASIFVHLCGINKQTGQYTHPCFDVKKASLPCAIFSYIVHIIRDFQKDQNDNLNYFADDLITKHGLNRQILKDIASGGKIENNFRNLIKEYYLLADQYRQKTYKVIEEIRPCLGPRYQLSLDIIFSLYLMVFERIDIRNGKFTAEELNPTPEDIKKRVYKTILYFRPS